MGKKLNKNQTTFFREAVKYFGDDTKKVKYIDITRFAEMHGLTVPISFLKNYCKTGERGFYDLTKSGISSEDKPTGLFALTDEVPEDDSDVFEFNEDIESDSDQPEVIETSAYADDIKPKFVPECFKKSNPIKTIWKNPVYVVTNQDGDVTCVCDDPVKAYKSVNYIFHGPYSLTEHQAYEALEKYGEVHLVCMNARSLRASITMFEMNKSG